MGTNVTGTIGLTSGVSTRKLVTTAFWVAMSASMGAGWGWFLFESAKKAIFG